MGKKVPLYLRILDGFETSKEVKDLAKEALQAYWKEFGRRGGVRMTPAKMKSLKERGRRMGLANRKRSRRSAR